MADVVRQSHPFYVQGDPDNPRQDPTYVERIAEELLQHRGERVDLGLACGGDPWSRHESINCLRRLGWEIEGVKGSAGYTFIRWTRPQRWTRLDSVYREHVGAIVMRPKRHRTLAAPAGQLELCL